MKTMDKTRKHNITKVYCSKCDMVFESREKFEKHFDLHSAGVSFEACPIDTAISKIFGFFRRRPRKNLE